MWDWIRTNITTIVGFVLASLIIIRMINERRNPSNFFAWFFLIIFLPPIGVPLYFLLGGRKSRRMARMKGEVQEVLASIVHDDGSQNTHEDPLKGTDTKGTTFGNRITLLGDGQVAFERLCREIQAAEQSVHVATFILSDDFVGNRIVDLLCEKAQQGVEVKLLVDALGSWPGMRGAQRRLAAAGGRSARFIPVLPLQSRVSANLRNHRKVAIFDRTRAITGGQNLDIRFLGTPAEPAAFHDFSIVIEGPAVAHLTRVFVSDWAFAAKESPQLYTDLLRFEPEAAGDSTVEIIPSGPDARGDPLWEQLLRIIQEFKQSLTIITPYFVPDEVLFRSMQVKAHTGRRIRLVLPLHSNHRIADIASYHYLRQLHDTGVEILFYTPGMLHGKLILADGAVAMTGSANIDMRSLFVNFEIGLFHYTQSDIELFQTWADAVIADCIPFSEAKRAQAGKTSRIVEDFVHLVVPLL